MSDIEFTKVPKFLRRLYRETSDPTNSYIRWSDDGEKVRIVSKDRFIKHTLPILSRTKEYSAFIRQLNIYGFIKMKSEKNDDVEEYYNCFFKKDEPHLMSQIRRVKKFERMESKLNYSSLENSIAYLTNSNFRLSNELSQLKEKVERQERTINGLFEILGKVFRTGAQNISFETHLSNIRKDFSANLLECQKNKRTFDKFGKLIEKKDYDDKSGKHSNESFVADMNDIFF
ncbi:Heat shock transcription factor [Glugoides intestinalis]